LYGAETWTFQEAEQKCFETFETLKKDGQDSWVDRVRDELLHRVKEDSK
jgi:hypothetical protein